MELALKNWTWPSLRLRSSRKRKHASTSSDGSGRDDPTTRIQPETGGAMNTFWSLPDRPSAHEHGLGLWSARACWTARRFLFLMASQQFGRLSGEWRKPPAESSGNGLVMANAVVAADLRDLQLTMRKMRKTPTIKTNQKIESSNVAIIS